MTSPDQHDDATREKPTESLFITGWLTDRFAAGHRPVYGYPHSPLPEVSGGDMEVVTGYMAAAR